MILTNIFFGILIIAAGVFALKYNYQLVNSFGNDNWFEQHLGAGSTYGVVKIFSVLLILFGLLKIFGLDDDITRFIFSPLSGIFKN